MEIPIDIEKIKLTTYSRGAGCGCKIAPQVLAEILQSDMRPYVGEKLLVGNSTNDDAAAYDMGDGNALISTTDFFMPVVDDAFDFGRIASANAISDVYAMGGRPLLALAILGWPIDKLPASLARRVLDGARTVCGEAGIPLAGGHSIDSTEPVFGLSVSGMVPVSSLKRNNTGREGDLLFLTKPLGSGILSTAQKRDLLRSNHLPVMLKYMTALNRVGETLGKVSAVTAMTDVTGFGLLGHLIEMAEGAGLSAEIYYSRLPVFEGVGDYLALKSIPDATYRNWNSYGKKAKFEKGVNVMEAFSLLPDPQTNGGLLFSVDPGGVEEVLEVLRAAGLQDHLQPIGKFIPVSEKVIEVKQ